MTIKIDTPDTLYGTEKAVESKVEDKQSAPVAEKVTEQNESTESDTGETEQTKDEAETEDKDAKAESESENESEDAKESDSDKPKKKGGFQRRIDKLNARVADREKELEYWKQMAVEKKTAGESKDESKVETKKADTAGKPDPNDFESHVDYVEALTDWKIEQKAKAKEAEDYKNQALTEHQKTVSEYKKRVDAFAEKTSDFWDVFENVEDVPVSGPFQEMIVTSENGPEIMYALAKDRKEFERIAKLPPLAAARAIGKLEEKLSAKSTTSEKEEHKKITKAPRPLEPVGSGGKASASKSIADPGLSQAEYERMRREQMKKRTG